MNETRICRDCFESKADHHEFTPIAEYDMPKNCKCDPTEWGCTPSDICKEFKGNQEENCDSCEHDFECHL